MRAWRDSLFNEAPPLKRRDLDLSQEAQEAGWKGLDNRQEIGFKSLYPAPFEGASDQRHETRGGMRQPLARKTFRAWGTGSSRILPSRLPAWAVEDCPPGMSEQTRKAPRAERRRYSAVRGDFARVDKNSTSHTGPRAG